MASALAAIAIPCDFLTGPRISLADVENETVKAQLGNSRCFALVAWVPSSKVTATVLSLTTMDYASLEPGQSLGGPPLRRSWNCSRGTVLGGTSIQAQIYAD
ncbi:hypothetical protein Bbelb_020520 [Branchiostoma belcheri]|nr:hypothetical protein Bbelb_020520 [Branchiostoma belcheri]